MDALFVAGAVALVGLTLALLLRPSRRRHADEEASARELNARVYRDQLAELDRDLAAGTLSREDHAQARTELQRRLLADAAQAPAEPAVREPDTAPEVHRHRTSLWIVMVLPLAATALYAWLGTPAAVSAAARQAAAEPTMAQVEQMVAALAQRLEQHPDDPKGWSMLARSYHVMRRFDDAAKAFARVGPALERDPDGLTAYADTLATLGREGLEGKPLQLVQAALAIDPDHPMALSLAATAAYQRKDFPTAARHWQRLLPQLPPDSDDARLVARTLAEIGGAPVGASAGAASGGAASGGAGAAAAQR